MGLFSGKTVISVASSVYNLAGDEKDRPIFLQNLIIRNVLSGTKQGLGETIPKGYLSGPGIQFRSFFRWAVENYDLIGMPTGSMYSGDVINTTMVGNNIPKAANESIWVQEARFGDSDYGMWAEQWMIKNYPAELQTAWEADFNDSTKTVTVKRTNGMVHTFPATGFVNGAKYIFAYYTRSVNAVAEPVVLGTVQNLPPGEPFPSVTGYTLVSQTPTERMETLNKNVEVVKTYSDSRPDVTTNTPSSTIVSVTRTVSIYDKKTIVDNDTGTDAVVSRRDIRNLFEDKAKKTQTTTTTSTVDIGGGVIETTTTTTTEELLESENSYRDDTQKITEKEWLPLELWIYRIGSGIAELDNLLNVVSDYGQFFPMIPFRLDNKFLSEIPGMSDELALAKKAFKKAFGGKYNDILEQLAESEDLEDMDYIYAVFGVSLNAIDRSARRYMYEFFQRLMGDQIGGANSAAQFNADMQAYVTAYNAWLAWKQRNSGGGSGPLFGSDPEPVIPPKPTLPSNEIVIKSDNINYDIRLLWNFITEHEQTGLGKVGARFNDLWFEYRGETVIEDPMYTGNDNDGSGVISDNTLKYETVRLYWQYEENKYRYMDLSGLVHKNYVYEGKNVTITAKEALDDGDESGFIVPLHYATFRAARLVDSTQMSGACVYLVFNCYEKVKQKWWQTGFFKVIFAVVVAIVSVAFTGGAGLGLLGSNLAVGSALGLTGISAAIAGSIANALAALVLTTVISKVTENLGIIGAIIGAVISMAISGAMMSLQNGGGFNFNFAELMKAENILKLIDAAGQGYQAYVRGSITDMQNDLVKLQEQTNAELKRVREAFFDQFGYGGGQIDPMMFIGSSPVIAESRDTFLARTLMTGSDVADMSHEMLNSYVELTQTLPNAFT